MNKIVRGKVPSKAFDIIMRYIFDDPETVDETYLEHSECRVVQVARIESEADLIELANILGPNSDVGALHGIKLSELVGHWMLEGTRSDSNGMYWDTVDEIVKCHEVTETITVTKWKPIPDAEKSSTESVPARPAGKK